MIKHIYLRWDIWDLNMTNPIINLCWKDMLKLKPQYFRHLMRRTDSFEKTLILGKIEGGRRRGWQRWGGWMISPTQWTWVWVNSGSWWWTGGPGVLRSMGSQRVGHDWATELNWTWLFITITKLCNAGDSSPIPWLGGSPRKGNGYPLQ